jgi:hypothetical protein
MRLNRLYSIRVLVESDIYLANSTLSEELETEIELAERDLTVLESTTYASLIQDRSPNSHPHS